MSQFEVRINWFPIGAKSDGGAYFCHTPLRVDLKFHGFFKSSILK